MADIVSVLLDFLFRWGILAWIPIAFIGWILYGIVALIGHVILSIVEAGDERRRVKREAKATKKREARATASQSDGGSSDSGRGMWATGGYDPERYASQAHDIGYGNIDMVREVYGSFDDYYANRPGD